MIRTLHTVFIESFKKLNCYPYTTFDSFERKFLMRGYSSKKGSKSGKPPKCVDSGKKKNEYKSMAKHNYVKECETAVNKQINMELYAAYWYTSLQYHFDRDDMGLPGFVKYFQKAAKEELEHANHLMVFQRKRGGKLEFFPVEPPPSAEWTALCAVTESLALEKTVTKSLEDLVTLAGGKGDHHLDDFICNVYLNEQYQCLKEMADLLARIKRAGPGCGLVLVDNELQNMKK